MNSNLAGPANAAESMISFDLPPWPLRTKFVAAGAMFGGIRRSRSASVFGSRCMANKRHQQTASGRTVWFGSDAPGELQKLASDLGEPKPFHECRACVDDDSNVPLGFVSWAENLMMVGMAVWMILKPIGMTH